MVNLEKLFYFKNKIKNIAKSPFLYYFQLLNFLFFFINFFFQNIILSFSKYKQFKHKNILKAKFRNILYLFYMFNLERQGRYFCSMFNFSMKIYHLGVVIMSNFKRTISINESHLHI